MGTSVRSPEDDTLDDTRSNSHFPKPSNLFNQRPSKRSIPQISSTSAASEKGNMDAFPVFMIFLFFIHLLLSTLLPHSCSFISIRQWFSCAWCRHMSLQIMCNIVSCFILMEVKLVTDTIEVFTCSASHGIWKFHLCHYTYTQGTASTLQSIAAKRSLVCLCHVWLLHSPEGKLREPPPHCPANGAVQVCGTCLFEDLWEGFFGTYAQEQVCGIPGCVYPVDWWLPDMAAQNYAPICGPWGLLSPHPCQHLAPCSFLIFATPTV